MSGVAKTLSKIKSVNLKINAGALRTRHGYPRLLPSLVFRSFGDRGGVDDKQIEDFNTELDFVFGVPPNNVSRMQEEISRNSKEVTDSYPATQDPESQMLRGKGSVGRENALSHVDAAGKASMVNVIDKRDSPRVAIASGKVFLGLVAFNLVAANSVAKGDVLTVAKIAGIQGAKFTSSLIPLCHNILLSGVDITLSLDESLHAVNIRAQATTTGPTGVEMEALTAVSVAGLTVYDMCKAVSKGIRISDVQLESKTGGKSGDWFRSQARAS